MRKYYYIVADEKYGPLTYEELKEKRLPPHILVWFPGLDTWQELSSIPELKDVYYIASTQKPKATKSTSNNTNKVVKQSQLFKKTDDKEKSPNYLKGIPTQTKGNKPPKNWLAESILTTLFCCSPFGIVGIIYASKVHPRWNKRDIAGAHKAAETAKIFTLIGLIPTIIFIIILFYQILMEI